VEGPPPPRQGPLPIAVDAHAVRLRRRRASPGVWRWRVAPLGV